MTPNMRDTMQWLRTNGFMVKGQPMLTIEQKDDISRAYSAGNYANAYETTDLTEILTPIDEMPEHERVAFVLGFFASYSLDEIGSDREIFDECYHSEIGRYIVHEAGYCDSRADEYSAQERYDDESNDR